jgi:hypothetical protein
MKQVIYRDMWPDDSDRECSHGQMSKNYTASGDSDKENVPPKILGNDSQQRSCNHWTRPEIEHGQKQRKST